jgi:uncharacterized repeat protein (TIGR03943 family)
MDCCQADEKCCRPPAGRSARLWIEILTLAAVAGYLLFSYFSGRAGFFVAAAYVWMAPAAAALILAMAAARFLSASGDNSCGCEEDHRGRIPLWLCAATILASVAMAVVVDPKAYSMDQMRKRRAPVLARDTELEDALAWILGQKPAPADQDAAQRTLPQNPTILQLIQHATLSDRSKLEGQYVTVVGQCDLRDGPAGSRFDIYRLVVTCCVADAQAVAVEVARTGSESLDDRGWVSIGGVLRFDSQIDPSMPVIHAATITKISPPTAPYL